MNKQQIELAVQLGQMLKQRGWRVTCAESCTGGGVAAAITAIAGSSDWFDAGFVTYSNAMKQQLLKVSVDTLNSHGAVSQKVVEQMANGAIVLAGAEVAVAVSGIAGPDGGSTDKPVGTVWFAWAGPDRLATKRCLFSGDRAAVQEQAVVEALRGLLALCE